MTKRSWFVFSLLALLAFLIPIEHKYDKLFRFFSLTLIPEGVAVSKQYDPKIYFYVSDLIGLVFLGLAFKRDGAKLLLHPLWVVFLYALLSIAASPFASYPIPYIRLWQLMTPIALFLFLSKERIPRVAQGISIAIVAAGLFQSAIAIAQYFHQAPLGLRFLGENKDMAVTLMSDKTRWIVDSWLGLSMDSQVLVRAAGTFPHANVFGGFMVLSLLLSYYLFIKEQSAKWIVWTLPFQIFALFTSYSRSALFAWALASSLWFALMIYSSGFNTLLRRLFFWVSASLLASFFLLFPQYAQRGGVISSSSLASQSNEIRKIHQKAAVDILRDHPLFGVGFTQFSERTQEYYSPEEQAIVRVGAPHNIFLFLGCETGIIAALALAFFLFQLFYRFAQSELTLENQVFFSLLVGFLFISVCDFYPILFQQGKLMFFLIAALLSLNTFKRPQLELVK